MAATAGQGIIRASVIGTAIFTVLALAALATDALVPVFVIVSLFMFLAGSGVFLLAFFRAVDRSRTEAIGIGGLFFGAGSTPGRVQALLMASLAVEVVVSIAVAVIRLYTALAFGTLAPMWALGLAGLWVARYGAFPARAADPTRTALRDADRAAHRRPAEPRAPTEASPPSPTGPERPDGASSPADPPE